ncbi:MAG TPA: hypothetical protein VJU53_06665, partial [Burkholderiaceae bacterium]|nr:hypothetical protein [Burkholderiaceae bacterium]
MDVLNDSVDEEVTLFGRTKSFTACSAVSMLFLFVAGQAANAQTPAQIEYERQQREYARQQEQQRQEQQRQQQIMQENARRQQEELNRSIRATTPGSSIPSAPSRAGVPTTPGTSSPPSGARSEQETRQTWERQPPLARDRNPLLGRWYKMKPADPFPMVQGGACGLFFGTEFYVEFRPSAIVAVSRDGREQVVAQVIYRGGGKRVAVLKKGQPYGVTDLFVFDIGDRYATLSDYDCKMTRAILQSP